MTVRVKLRISLSHTTFSSLVVADTIASAVEDAKVYWQTSAVTVIFPLDSDAFFADTSQKED